MKLFAAKHGNHTALVLALTEENARDFITQLAGAPPDTLIEYCPTAPMVLQLTVHFGENDTANHIIIDGLAGPDAVEDIEPLCVGGFEFQTEPCDGNCGEHGAEDASEAVTEPLLPPAIDHKQERGPEAAINVPSPSKTKKDKAN